MHRPYVTKPVAAWLGAPDYWLSRFAIERALAAVYLIAFLTAKNQFPALLGERGLLPVPRLLSASSFRDSPSLFHFHYSDRLLVGVTWIGIVLSGVTLAGVPQSGPTWVSMLTWLALWVLYMSIVNVGQTFYAFGWETILLEAGFLAIFLGPAATVPQAPVIWLFRWLLFRVELGAGLIKLRGDPCWRDLTCLYYHYETQPMPNPLSWYFHHLPKPAHKLEVAGSHFIQVIVPFALFAPQPMAGIAGSLMLVHQVWLVFSGNFSWLNILTLALTFSAFDDAELRHLLPLSHGPLAPPPAWHLAVVLAMTALIVVLSYWPIRNLISRHQLMNASFNRLHLASTYGAFGSITRRRYEVILEGTDEPRVSESTAWRAYELKGKPGDPKRRPRQVAPYHLRLDWLMWFAAMSTPMRHPWLLALMMKLLTNDEPALRLIGRNPFAEKPPTFVRATLFQYRFTSPSERRQTRAWWVRTYVGEYLPPLSLGLPRAEEA
jgi:hypothetical protein